jgi:hypothetical protein
MLKKTFVCRQCRFAALVPVADGWKLLDANNTGICPACVSELEAAQPSGNGSESTPRSDINPDVVRRN